jgi:hypothetical protein
VNFIGDPKRAGSWLRPEATPGSNGPHLQELFPKLGRAVYRLGCLYDYSFSSNLSISDLRVLVLCLALARKLLSICLETSKIMFYTPRLGFPFFSSTFASQVFHLSIS